MVQQFQYLRQEEIILSPIIGLQLHYLRRRTRWHSALTMSSFHPTDRAALATVPPFYLLDVKLDCRLGQERVAHFDNLSGVACSCLRAQIPIYCKEHVTKP